MGIKNRFNNLKESMFKQDNFPKLKGRAAEIRWLVKPLMTVFGRHMDRNNAQHRYVYAGLRFSFIVEEILDLHPTDFMFPADVYTKLKAAIFGFLNMNVALSDFYHAQGVFLFKFTIKAHYLAHIAIYSRWYNPRLAWAYSGEDFMQICKKIVQSCQRGSPPHLVCSKAVGKYSEGLAWTMVADHCWAS